METIYNVDYLKSISKEKLLELAKKRPEFNMALMERELKLPKDAVRFAIKRSVSKYDKKIRKYLINFLTSKPVLDTSDADFDLEELFLEANKYQLVTNVSVAKALNCSDGTVSLCKTGKYKGKISYRIKQYLENIIEQGKLLGTELPKDFNLEELFEEANKYQKITISKIAKDLDFHRETISENIHGKRKGQTAYKIKEYLENIIEEYDIFSEIRDDQKGYDKKEETLTTNYNINYLNNLTLTELFDLAKNKFGLTHATLERNLSIPEGVARYAIKAKNSKYGFDIKNYLVEFLLEKDLEARQEIFDTTHELNLMQLFDKARKYQHLTTKRIAEDLNCSISAVYSSIQGKSTGKIAHKVRDYLKNIIEANNSFKEIRKDTQENEEENDNIWEEIDKKEQREQETMTEETLTDTKEMKTYDEFLNFINTQKELPIVKKALDETLSENQNLEKILAKEEFITIETAQELNEKIFANEYTEAEILDFENQYYGTVNDDSLKDKIKAFVEKHNLSLETALKLLQISEEDYKKMLEGADKVSNKAADKIYKAIIAFEEVYKSEKTQDAINNTKNTFVTGIAIASAKGQTFLNKGLNKFADFLNKSADKIKNSNSDKKED